ncbi:MAG: pyridoxal phosphate-dependent aminotransferase [Gammaproteobacteria bacterium]|nr:pyridoxal phosphate-dependent aminotransferase [Gammaproteobacteria bacterium]
MDMHLAKRMQRVKPSPTLAVAEKAAKLKAQGLDIIGLGTGEPDFDTPAHIKDAAIKAIEAGFTKYTAVDGIPDLKKAIQAKLNNENQLDYELNQIIVGTGGKQCCYNLCMALLNPGDEVIIPAPYWVSYPDMVMLAEAVPVFINTSAAQHFKITAKQLKAAITPKTKLFFINSPSNPSGVAYNTEELQALAEVLLAYPQIWIATDDMYEHILWQKPFVNIVNVEPQLKARTIVLNGVSKAYAMTGWRIGYAAGDVKLIEQMKSVQSQSTSNPCSIAQKAAVAALTGDQQVVATMNEAFQNRHTYVLGRLQQMAGIEVVPADGTFYLFPDVSKIIEKKGYQDDLEFAEKLLQEQGLAIVPGSAFGTPGCIRLSFATSQEILEKALDRLEKFINH